MLLDKPLSLQFTPNLCGLHLYGALSWPDIFSLPQNPQFSSLCWHRVCEPQFPGVSERFSVIAAAAAGVCGGTCSTDTAEKKLKYLRQQEGRGAYLLDSSPSQTRQALTKLRVDMQLDSNMENITPASSCPAVTPLCCWFRHSVGLGVTSVSLSLLGPSWHSNSGCRKLCCVAALKTRVQICITAKITWLVMSH